MLPLLCLWPLGAFAAESDTAPAQTQTALHALLRASKLAVPTASGCNGQYGQPGRATIGDVLSMQLAYLHRGDNTIAGRCAEGQCELRIAHAFGEEVASAELRFKMRQGRAVTSSLRCIITP